MILVLYLKKSNLLAMKVPALVLVLSKFESSSHRPKFDLDTYEMGCVPPSCKISKFQNFRQSQEVNRINLFRQHRQDELETSLDGLPPKYPSRIVVLLSI